jgi:hypothetical protein
MPRKIDALEEFFPELARLARGPVQPKPSPRLQALKDRLAVLGNEAGIERVGNHWEVWYRGKDTNSWPTGLRVCANLRQATYAVEDFEDEAIRAIYGEKNLDDLYWKKDGTMYEPGELVNKYLKCEARNGD